jgi:deoxycytidylate deaminase
MEKAAKQLEIVAEEKERKKIKDRISDTHTEELVFGLCGPIGTDIHFVADRIEEKLTQKYNYECITIKLSDLIKRKSGIGSMKSAKSFDDYSKLIDEGNKLREKYGNSVLAELAINEITKNRERRKKELGKDGYDSLRVCYIIDSIKHIEELELFRLIYTDYFYFFGIFSPMEMRISNLKNYKGIEKEKIHELIKRDSGENFHFGQKVTDTFVESDFFMRVENNSAQSIDKKVNRYLNLVFDSDIETPTNHETAMYSAFSAAGNSACLSRQVGASITDSKGEILSLGWNDVPKAGGGVYQFNNNDGEDNRCKNIKNGYCHNDAEKRIISEAILEEFVSSGIIKKDKKKEIMDIISKSRIKELIEFSRAVHAEMLALILGCQKAGDRIIEGKLYCTTYPCHNCARHIIASGISEVYYIEPYNKSLATKLHWDSISENEKDKGKVRLLMYDGVAPRRYLFFFKMKGKRKENGNKIIRPPKNIKPKKTLSLQAIPILETKVTESLRDKNLL